MTTLRITVDPVACEAYGYCAELVPEAIVLDEWGYPMVDGRPCHLQWLHTPSERCGTAPRGLSPCARGKRRPDRRGMIAAAPTLGSTGPCEDSPVGHDDAADTPRVPYGTIVRQWGRIGCTGFGGPPAHISMLRQLCVEREGWLDPTEFEDAVATTNLLPGPASTQLAILCAWRLRGWSGAILGGLCFIVPGLGLIIALAALFLSGHPPRWVAGAALGMGAAVAAVRVERRHRAHPLQLAAGGAHSGTTSSMDRLCAAGRRFGRHGRPISRPCPAGLRNGRGAHRPSPSASQHPQRLLHGTVAGCRRADGRHRGPDMGGLQGRRSLVRRRFRDRSPDAGGCGEPLPLDDECAVPRRCGLGPDHARPGGPDGGRGRLRRRRRRRRPPRDRRGVRTVVHLRPGRWSALRCLAPERRGAGVPVRSRTGRHRRHRRLIDPIGPGDLASVAAGDPGRALVWIVALRRGVVRTLVRGARRCPRRGVGLPSGSPGRRRSQAGQSWTEEA